MDNKTPLYVLNKFLKFEKKIYRFEDVKMPSPISLKVLMYYMASFLVFGIVVLLPGPGTLIRMLPGIVVAMIVFGVPFLVAHTLAGVGTENRPPINAFKALVNFHIMKMKRETYYKGKIMKRPQPVRYRNHSTVTIRGTQSNESTNKLSSETHRRKPGI